jgi:hypothetical protein
MKYTVYFIAMLLLLSGCKEDNQNAQPTPDNREQTAQQDKNIAEGNEPAHRFELLAAKNAEELSQGVFLVGWIRASLGENDSEVQTIPVEMDEPYVHWVQWGLEKQDVNFDGYTDIAVARHGGAKWGKLFWWLYDPETKRFYRNTLTDEISKLTHAWFWTVPETKEIKIKKYYGTEATEYTYRIVEGHLRQVGLAGLRVEKAKYWRQRGYSFDPNVMTAYEMEWKVKDIEMPNSSRPTGSFR